MLSAHFINNTSKTFSKFLLSTREILFQDFYYNYISKLCGQFVCCIQHIYCLSSFHSYNNVISLCIFIGCWPWSIKGDAHTYMPLNPRRLIHANSADLFFGCSKHLSKYSLKSKTSQRVKNKSHTTRLRLVHVVPFVLYMLGYYLWNRRRHSLLTEQESHLLTSSCACRPFCSLQAVISSMIYYSVRTRKNVVYLLNKSTREVAKSR